MFVNRKFEKSLKCEFKGSNDDKQLKIFVTTQNGIFFLKLFWPTVRKNWTSDWEKLLKFEAESREFEKKLRSLEQFIRKVEGQYYFWSRILLGAFSVRTRTIWIQMEK